MKIPGLDEYVARTLAEAPPLAVAQTDQLSALFHRRGSVASTPPPKAAPKPTKIYRHFDKCGCLMYVGISYDPVTRNYAHASTSWWTKWVDRIQIDEAVFENRSDATNAERELIESEGPVFNTVHALDKRTSIIGYLIRHERWEHLSAGRALDQLAKRDVLRSMDRAGIYDGVTYYKEPIALAVDWSDPLLRRFVAKVEVDDGHWLWQGHVTARGYGTFRHPDTKWAHRAAWLLLRGPIPDSHEVIPRCETKGCVNPAHLALRPSGAPRRTVLGSTERCAKNHPGSDPRWAKKADGRSYCRECNKVRAKRARIFGEQMTHAENEESPRPAGRRL